jgi:hypothetical protein
MRCDVIADGVVTACKAVNLTEDSCWLWFANY